VNLLTLAEEAERASVQVHKDPLWKIYCQHESQARCLCRVEMISDKTALATKVCCGSWLCKNATALNANRTDVSLNGI
jgi:hypothetical protein